EKYFPAPSVAQLVLERSLRHRHQEPRFKDEKTDDRYRNRESGHGKPRVASDPPHVKADIEGRGDVEADEMSEKHHGSRGPKHLEDRPELFTRNECFTGRSPSGFEHNDPTRHDHE